MNATHHLSQQLINAQKELARRRQMAGVSAPLSVADTQWSVNRERGLNDDQRPAASDTLAADRHGHQSASPRSLPNSCSPTVHPRSVRLSPTLAAYCLDRGHRPQGAALDGPYRLYKVLGALDEAGRGWLASEWVAAQLTRKESRFYIYGRRQLKIMLRRGEGLFWHRVRSQGQVRIRLVARMKVVEALGLGRLRGREVSFPLAHLLGSGRGRQADANAALYAAVHAGSLRPDVTRAGETKPRPIARARLQEVAGCSPYRQRSYERRMHIRVQTNIHILGKYSDYALQRARRHLGLPAYRHIDTLGQVNRHERGAAYIAVRLPNSYQVPETMTVVHSRRQRTINRFLDGLCHMGSGGSGREEIVRLFHSDGGSAVRSFERDQETPAYWPLIGGHDVRLWQSCQAGGAVQSRNPQKGGDLN